MRNLRPYSTPMRRPSAIAALLVVLVAGCGAGHEEKAKPGPRHRSATLRERGDISATISQLQAAIERRDAPAVCRLYSEGARKAETEFYATCATAVRSDLRRLDRPRLSVGKIEVRFDSRQRPRVLQAIAEVTSSAAGRDPFTLHAGLVLEGGLWRVKDKVIDYLERHPAG